MGIIGGLRTMRERLFNFALEPDRLDAWLKHLAECGVCGEVEWRPQRLRDGLRAASHAFYCLCYGKLRLHNTAIDRIELRKGPFRTGIETPGMTRERLYYVDRFLVDVPRGIPVVRIRARRKAKQAYWIAGEIVGYQWSGGAFAQRLAADRPLNGALEKSGERWVRIRYERTRHAYAIIRSYVGRTTELRTGLVTGINLDVDRDLHLPQKDALEAFHRIAQHIRDHAGLAQKP